MTESLLPQLDFQFLTQLRMIVTGNTLCILLKATEQPPTSPIPTPWNKSLHLHSPNPHVPPPHVISEITHPQFRKFKIDWNVFKQITTIPPHQITAQLYNLCDDYIQNALINTVTDVFQLPENNLLKVIECVVTKRSNPTIHCMHFGNITQYPTESIKEDTVWLKSAAIDCKFSCPGCQLDLVPIDVKD